MADTADEILARMAKTYATLQSYSDTGVVLLHMHAGEEPNQTNFETTFLRPYHFRFVWVSHHPFQPLSHLARRSVIWSDGTGSFARYGFRADPEKTEIIESLATAIAGATGVSGGAARNIPVLLMPQVALPSLRNLTDARLLGTEPMDAVNAYHITGSLRGRSLDLWIGTDDFLVRKTQEMVIGMLVEELHQHIRINETIPEARFGPEIHEP